MKLVCACLSATLVCALACLPSHAAPVLAHATITPAGQFDVHAAVPRVRSVPSASAAVPALRPAVRAATSAEVQLAFAAPPCEVTTIATPHGEFTLLSLPGAGYTDVYGAPMLPVVRALLAVPDGVDVQCAYSSTPRDVSAAELGVPAEPLPLQPPVPKRPGALEAAPFVRAAAAYAAAAFFPSEPARIVPAGRLAGQRLVMLELAPVQFSPAQRVYRLHADLAITVSFHGQAAPPAPRSPREDALVRELVCNAPAAALSFT